MAPRKTVTALALALAAAAPCLAQRPDNPGKEPRFVLRQRFEPGKYRMVQTTETQQKITVGPNMPPMAMKATQEMTSELVVSKPDAKGNKKMVLAFTRIKMSAPGMEFDSDDPGSMDKSPMAGVFKPLLKTKMVMVVDKQGRTVSAKGMDAMWDEMAKANPTMKPLAEKLKKQMGDGMMNQMLGAANQMMLTKPVGLGAVWHRKVTQELPVVGKATVDSECELTQLKKTPAGQVATIQFTADLKSTGGTDMGVPGVAMKVEKMDLKQTGRIALNVETGMVSEHRVNQKGQVGMSITGPEGQKQEMASDIESKTKMTVVPLK